MTTQAADGTTERGRIARRLAEIACAAGAVLVGHHGGHCAHSFKEDGSPASVADLEAEALIIARLAESFPGIPVVAEETCRDVPPAPRFFLGLAEARSGNPQEAARQWWEVLATAPSDASWRPMVAQGLNAIGASPERPAPTTPNN